jgi:phosphatidylglycerophosphate synthase
MSHHTTIHRLVRPAVRMAARARLTPNQVTTMRLATGLSAAVLFAQGTYGLMAYGGFICLISLLLDRVDGDLARLTNQKSAFGYRYDLISDCVASIATFIGLGIGVAYADGSDALWLGVLAGVGIGVLFFELNVLNVVDVPGHELFGGRLTVDPDDAMLFVPILIWCGLASLTVTVAAILAPLAAIGVAVLGLRRWRAPVQDDGAGKPAAPKVRS